MPSFYTSRTVKNCQLHWCSPTPTSNIFQLQCDVGDFGYRCHSINHIFYLKVFHGEFHQYCLYIYNEESTDHPFWIGPRFTKNGLSWFDPVQGLKFYLVPIRFGPRFLKLFGSGPWFPVYNERFSFEDRHSFKCFYDIFVSWFISNESNVANFV